MRALEIWALERRGNILQVTGIGLSRGTHSGPARHEGVGLVCPPIRAFHFLMRLHIAALRPPRARACAPARA